MVPDPSRLGRPAPAAPNGKATPTGPPTTVDLSEIPVGTALLVTTLEPIDLLTVDQNRRYKAQLERPAVVRGATLLPQGTEVLLKVSRQDQPGLDNAATVFMITADSTTFNGKSIPLITTGSSVVIPSGAQHQQFT